MSKAEPHHPAGEAHLRILFWDEYLSFVTTGEEHGLAH